MALQEESGTPGQEPEPEGDGLYAPDPPPEDDRTPSDEEEQLVEITPTIDTEGLQDRFVNYTMKGSNDAVLSGPVMNGWGPGQYYKNRYTAYEGMVAKYGAARVRPTERQSLGRWSMIIRGLKLRREA